MYKRFNADMRRYWRYAIYSSRALLKAEVANSYLNWLWWVVEPFCFMHIYNFMYGFVFGSKEPYFSLFIFTGITLWNFFDKTVIQSVKLVKANKPIVSKVYLPKYILILVRMGVNGFKMGISMILIIGMLIYWRVPMTWNVLYSIPILITLSLITFGISCFLLHYGVFVEDLSNVMNIFLKLLFYMTGIFWNIEKKIPAPYSTIIGKCNPIAFLLTSMRNCVLYASTPHRKLLLMWFCIGVILSILGVRKIYKNENSYVKVV